MELLPLFVLEKEEEGDDDDDEEALILIDAFLNAKHSFKS